VRARKRPYDIGSIFETAKAVHALGFNLEQKKTENFVFSVRPGVVVGRRMDTPRRNRRARRSPLHCP